MKNNNKKILFTGGGTLGSVTPMLVIANLLNQQNKYDLLWLGTKSEREFEIVSNNQIKFISIFSGKLRRYFSLKNITDLFLIFLGFFQAFFIILKFKPDLIIGAGGFVSVPVAWAGWLLRVPIIIHQLDYRATLSNKLIAPIADLITVTFEKSLHDYNYKKTIWIGNPIKQEFKRVIKTNSELISKEFNLKQDFPVVFVTGGSSGATGLNSMIQKALPELISYCQIVHVVGPNKILNYQNSHNYHVFESFNYEQMSKLMKLATIVVSRCGIAALTELAFLAKPCILIPMPQTHQNDNANLFANNQAVVVLSENINSSEELIREIKNLLLNQAAREKLSHNISKLNKLDAEEKFIKIIEKKLE